MESLRPRALARGVNVTLEATAATCAIEGDAGRIERALENLLDNALRHTPAGGTIALPWRIESGRAIFSIVDTGQGIAAQDLPHLFEPLYRGEASRNRETGGGGARTDHRQTRPARPWRRSCRGQRPERGSEVHRLVALFGAAGCSTSRRSCPRGRGPLKRSHLKHLPAQAPMVRQIEHATLATSEWFGLATSSGSAYYSRFNRDARAIGRREEIDQW